ncbi:MAG: DUF1508 domain-containing protein [Acetobacter aceti]|uniref:DUF1508 domain-containing protein n=1 Tax=Acetobacter aceti TaxID=435 RepID=A0A1U9KDJ8_ACEAC|nr:DUF1508 domain-containing protein [Acetobacter aceti]AQS83871.1 hypothetical protein A0U92_02755 [Acetobacter aceti]
MSAHFELFKDKAEEFHFRLKAPNGRIILVSESYQQKTRVTNGIESRRKNAPDASVIDLSHA